MVMTVSMVVIMIAITKLRQILAIHHEFFDGIERVGLFCNAGDDTPCLHATCKPWHRMKQREQRQLHPAGAAALACEFMHAHVFGHVQPVGFLRLQVVAHCVDDEPTRFACVVGYRTEILEDTAIFMSRSKSREAGFWQATSLIAPEENENGSARQKLKGGSSRRCCSCSPVRKKTHRE